MVKRRRAVVLLPVASSLAARAVGGGFAMHWNGSVWRPVNLPRVHGGLTGISIRSSRDAWGVGSRTTASGASAPWTVHWNGRAWTRVSTPDPGNGEFSDTAASGPKSSAATAVGYHDVLACGVPRRTLTEQRL